MLRNATTKSNEINQTSHEGYSILVLIKLLRFPWELVRRVERNQRHNVVQRRHGLITAKRNKQHLANVANLSSNVYTTKAKTGNDDTCISIHMNKRNKNNKTETKTTDPRTSKQHRGAIELRP
jgi:formate-dependent nitrite reductase cytochrome c552 subunit